MELRNQKVIQSIIQKAERICPGSLAMIGIYGSFLTGDIHEKSDLDLMVLINDERGCQLASTFIQDDLQIGHDIYCTTWEMLERDADFSHPHISKLMDSKIVYCADENYMDKLEILRNRVRDTLQKPFSSVDFTKANSLLKEAEHFYTRAMIAEDRNELLVQTGNVLYHIENTIAMLNKNYFRYGTKRVFEELEAMAHCPENLHRLIDNILSAKDVSEIKQNLTALMKETVRVFDGVQNTLSSPKAGVTADSLRGTYEEMFSNWRNKMYIAAQQKDRHLAFMSMTSLHAMLSEIGSGLEIGQYDVMDRFDPDNLSLCAQAYDEVLKEYLQEYRKVNITPRHFADIDAFVEDYLKKETAQ